MNLAWVGPSCRSAQILGLRSNAARPQVGPWPRFTSKFWRRSRPRNRSGGAGRAATEVRPELASQREALHLGCTVCFLLALGLCAPIQATEKIDEDLLKRYEARTFREASSNPLLYRFFKPPQYRSTNHYPLVLILHGAVGRGADNQKQFAGGNRVPPAAFAEAQNQATHPCFVVVPQCPVNDHWGSGVFGKPTETTRSTLALLDALPKEFSIDRARLYLVGLSMGGGGAWDLLSRHPRLFAAAVPICGAGDPAKAGLLTQIPIWCFHGDKDPLINVEYARRMMAAIRGAGGHPRYTEYPGVGHNSYVKAFEEPELLPWLFSQKRGSPSGLSGR